MSGVGEAVVVPRAAETRTYLRTGDAVFLLAMQRICSDCGRGFFDGSGKNENPTMI